MAAEYAVLPLRARSISSAVLPLLRGPIRDGQCLGLGYIDFDGYVLAVTRPGRPRMPNGIECDVDVAPRQRCQIGQGWLVVGQAGVQLGVLAGDVWDPVPDVRVRPMAEPGDLFEPDVEKLAGRGEGLTPEGDDLLAGYAAALFLFHDRRLQAASLAEAAAARTTRLSATLLRHAAVGELPEPAHALLERGDPGPLLRFGHTSGRCLMRGLAAGSAAC